jgi:hypothetical protein
MPPWAAPNPRAASTHAVCSLGGGRWQAETKANQCVRLRLHQRKRVDIRFMVACDIRSSAASFRRIAGRVCRFEPRRCVIHVIHVCVISLVLTSRGCWLRRLVGGRERVCSGEEDQVAVFIALRSVPKSHARCAERDANVKALSKGWRQRTLFGQTRGLKAKSTSTQAYKRSRTHIHDSVVDSTARHFLLRGQTGAQVNTGLGRRRELHRGDAPLHAARVLSLPQSAAARI